MKIHNLINGKRVHTISPSNSISNTVDVLQTFHVGALVVSSDGKKIEGIISERDIVRALPGGFEMVKDLSVREVMTTQVQTCTGEATVAQVMEMMTQQRIRHVPVVDQEGQLVSIVSIGDVVKHYLDELNFENQSLKDYVASAH